MTCHAQATTSLILKSSFIQWMEMQLLSVVDDERIAWTKIIENILLVVDSQHIEQVTKGEWQTGLVRCLGELVKGSGKLLSCISKVVALSRSFQISGLCDLPRGVLLDCMTGRSPTVLSSQMLSGLSFDNFRVSRSLTQSKTIRW